MKEWAPLQKRNKRKKLHNVKETRIVRFIQRFLKLNIALRRKVQGCFVLIEENNGG